MTIPAQEPEAVFPRFDVFQAEEACLTTLVAELPAEVNFTTAARRGEP